MEQQLADSSHKPRKGFIFFWNIHNGGVGLRDSRLLLAIIKK